MTSNVFEIKEHIIECQHIREYARATSTNEEEVLHLAIKQYLPLDNLEPKPGDITIIGAHANGFPKELYEPFWIDLHARSGQHGFKIRSIWIADVAQQGQSGILNEYKLGNDPSWNDHARDLLHMVNTFRAQMPLPIVGIGHSWGGNQLVNLSFMHPRLLSTVVLLDPVIQHQATAPSGVNPAQGSTFRRDLWPSREEAVESFKKQKFYQAWDPRVFDLWCEFGIRKCPSALFPNAAEGEVTLSTTKHQECFTFLRPSWKGMSEDGQSIINRELLPDMHPESVVKFPFYRPEPPNTLARLESLRPSAFYIWGETSPMAAPEANALKLEMTGIGLGGSGGKKNGRVEGVVLKGIGHLVAMEASGQCADYTAQWLDKEMKVIKEKRREYEEWTKKALTEKTTLSEEWQKRIGGPLRPPKNPSKSPKSKI